jgi:uncharacterized membrane protein
MNFFGIFNGSYDQPCERGLLCNIYVYCLTFITLYTFFKCHLPDESVQTMAQSILKFEGGSLRGPSGKNEAKESREEGGGGGMRENTL